MRLLVLVVDAVEHEPAFSVQGRSAASGCGSLGGPTATGAEGGPAAALRIGLRLRDRSNGSGAA